MAITVQGTINDTIYGKGDICLKLSPFDNYRMFTLYEDWRTDDRKPIDLSNGQKIYLVFKSGKKEIRIPEYDLVDIDYAPDKVNGQVLFKISKKNAINILALNTDIFYITRVYEVTDYSGERVISSEEEVLYTGRFRDESEYAVDSYTTQLKNATDLLAERNKQISDLMESNAKLMNQNAEYAEVINNLQTENEQMETEITDLETQVAQYESGTEYDGEIISDKATKYTIIEGKNYTEEQMQDAVDYLQDIYQE